MQNTDPPIINKINEKLRNDDANGLVNLIAGNSDYYIEFNLGYRPINHPVAGRVFNHAVFSIMRPKEDHTIRVFGLSKIGNSMCLALDQTNLPITFLNSGVKLTRDDARYLIDKIMKKCQDVKYNVLLENCFTPIYSALGEVAERMNRGANTKYKTDFLTFVKHVQRKISEINLGAGTTYSRPIVGPHTN